MWRFVANDIGEGREKALKEHFWKDMMNHGCKVQRFEDSMESAWKIINKPEQEFRQVWGTEIYEKSKIFSAKDRIVLVVGLTGAGKSTFISLATNRGDKPIGHDLKSHTKDIALTRAVNPFNGQSVIFVDTPGFNDTTRLDDEIFGIIVDFINKDSRVNLDTILWLHRISDNRANDMSPKYLEDILKTCNGRKMPHLILATTMWDEVNIQRGEEREKQLEMEIWKNMTEKGCKIHRFAKTHESAWEILRNVNAISRADILLSVEMTLKHRELKETEAGRTLNKQLQRLIKEQKEMKRSLKGMAGKHVDRAVKEELAKRMEEVEKKMASIAEQMNDLKLPLPRQLLRVFSGQSAPKVPTESAEVPFAL
ncbi:hypothetical protein CPB86DRAFT_796216 [Serendipita vermifera]|nr:hypothetical protein CPB86DRAFT_796216 [Serendipita vermifera]